MVRGNTMKPTGISTRVSAPGKEQILHCCVYMWVDWDLSSRVAIL